MKIIGKSGRRSISKMAPRTKKSQRLKFESCFGTTEVNMKNNRVDATSVARQVRICTSNGRDDAVMERLAKEVDYRKRREPLTQKFGLAAEYIDQVIREDEVLDTWFSSALWPHSTLGWPEKTPEAGLLVSDQRPNHQSRHHHAVGCADGSFGPEQHGRSPVPRGLHPSQDSRRRRGDDVEVEGERH